MNKTLTYIKEHRREILIGSGVVVGLVVLNHIFGVRPRTKTVTRTIIESNNVPIITSGLITDVWDDGTHLDLIIDKLNVKDLGQLGEDLVTAIPRITEDSEISLMMGVSKAAS